MKKCLSLTLILMLIVFVFAGCADNEVKETENTTEATTEFTTVETTEEKTEKETEEDTTKAPSTTKAPTTTKAPETTKPAPKPTEKPTQPKPTEPKPTQPSGGGLDTWNEEPLDPGGYVQDPNTDAEDIDKDAEENGWNTDWELN